VGEWLVNVCLLVDHALIKTVAKLEVAIYKLHDKKLELKHVYIFL